MCQYVIYFPEGMSTNRRRPHDDDDDDDNDDCWLLLHFVYRNLTCSVVYTQSIRSISTLIKSFEKPYGRMWISKSPPRRWDTSPIPEDGGLTFTHILEILVMKFKSNILYSTLICLLVKVNLLKLICCKRKFLCLVWTLNLISKH